MLTLTLRAPHTVLIVGGDANPEGVVHVLRHCHRLIPIQLAYIVDLGNTHEPAAERAARQLGIPRVVLARKSHPPITHLCITLDSSAATERYAALADRVGPVWHFAPDSPAWIPC